MNSYLISKALEDDMIQDNIAQVQGIMDAACKKAGRGTDEVTLITVSKTQPVEALQEAYAAGSRDFGENKVQELLDKIPSMPQDVRWHMIGHLQRNKVKYIVDKVCLIHSVDSLRLAEEISKEALKKQVDVDILIEVNVALEESKFGTTTADAISLVEQISKLPGVHIKGLMTIAPYVEDEEENRSIFKKLRELSVDIAEKNIDNVSMNILSMGMTGDYRVAIEEGATYVRVGTGIFGERDYSK